MRPPPIPIVHLIKKGRKWLQDAPITALIDIGGALNIHIEGLMLTNSDSTPEADNHGGGINILSSRVLMRKAPVALMMAATTDEDERGAFEL